MSGDVDTELSAQPDVWLQVDEAEGSAYCGCRLADSGDGARLYFCALHKSAHDLMTAMTSVSQAMEDADNVYGAEFMESLFPAAMRIRVANVLSSASRQKQTQKLKLVRDLS